MCTIHASIIYIYLICVRAYVYYMRQRQLRRRQQRSLARRSSSSSRRRWAVRAEGNHCVRTAAIGCERRRRRRPFKAFTPPPRTCVRLLYDERRLIVRARPIVAGDDVSPLMTTLINNIRRAGSFLDCAGAKISGACARNIYYIICFALGSHSNSTQYMCIWLSPPCSDGAGLLAAGCMRENKNGIGLEELVGFWGGGPFTRRSASCVRSKRRPGRRRQ